MKMSDVDKYAILYIYEQLKYTALSSKFQEPTVRRFASSIAPVNQCHCHILDCSQELNWKNRWKVNI